MDEMELKRKKSWVKHYDFILADFIVLQLSHVLANLIRYYSSSYGGLGYAFNLPIYKNEVIFLTVCLVASITFGDPYKNVLKNSKYVEFIKTFKHTLKMAMVNIVMIFFINDVGDIFHLRVLRKTNTKNVSKKENKALWCKKSYDCLYIIF